MTCGRYESWIALAAGGDLQPRRARRLEQHLAACERCREYAEAMTSAREVFHALGEEVVWDADFQAVRTAVMSRVAGEQVRPAFDWRWVFAPAVAAVGVLVVMLWSGVIEPRPPEWRGPIARDGRPERPPQAEGLPHQADTEPRPVGSGSPQWRGPMAREMGLAVTKVQSRATGPRHSRTRPAIQAFAPREPDGDIVVRLETNDPKVVIYWVMETGESE